jgi:signal transduction histidine kinase
MNAIRFYDEHKDSHIINIRLLTTPVKASIEIEDNGVGMTDAEANSVFEMFYRGSHKNAGSGVGLYVASEALKKINGNIKVESEYGQGSKFIIEIPNLA